MRRYAEEQPYHQEARGLRRTFVGFDRATLAFTRGRLLASLIEQAGTRFVTETLTPARVYENQGPLVCGDLEAVIESDILPVIRTIPVQHGRSSELEALDKLTDIGQAEMRPDQNRVLERLAQNVSCVVLKMCVR
jgi:hypothetical protein